MCGDYGHSMDADALPELPASFWDSVIITTPGHPLPTPRIEDFVDG